MRLKKILLIEADTSCRFGVVSFLSQKGYAVSVANNLANAEEDVLARRFDGVILGMSCADGKGSRFIKGVRSYDPCLPIIVTTGDGDIEVAVDAVRCGADNVLAKPVDFVALYDSLEQLFGDGSRKLAAKARPRPAKCEEEKFFGTGPAARKFHDLAKRAATGNQAVLITGETGTGKGLLARWIHQNGGRSAEPFSGLNCSGLRGDLLKAEIFGTAPEAGTAHARTKTGLITRVGNGTLFLDEIGDMALSVQARLLAALTGESPLPLGDGGAPGTGFRLICSSNQELDALARGGSFLPELLGQISATVLRIPPLRERLAELPGIVRHLLDGLRGPEAQITDEAMRSLKGYPWPGNLRELKNALEQGLIRSHGARLQPEHFGWLKPPFRARDTRPQLTMSELRERHLAQVLQQASGDINEVATSLGISRATMYRKLKLMRNRNF